MDYSNDENSIKYDFDWENTDWIDFGAYDLLNENTDVTQIEAIVEFLMPTEKEEKYEIDKKTKELKYTYVSYEEKANQYGRRTDGESSRFLNVALEYFNNRCALSGEKFNIFEGKASGRNNSLSAEHMVPIAGGGDDIVPNLLPTVLHYNLQKVNYYPIDYWKNAKDINGNNIFNPYRLLKCINYMTKASTPEAREYVKNRKFKKYRNVIMTPNEIDKFLEDKADELESDTLTTIEIKSNGKFALAPLPKLDYKYLKQMQIDDNRSNDRDMLISFLYDAINEIKEYKEIADVEVDDKNGDKKSIVELLDENLLSIRDNIEAELKLRKDIMSVLLELGINNVYSVANVIQNSNFFEGNYSEENRNKLRAAIIEVKNTIKDIGFDDAQTNELLSIKPEVIVNSEELEKLEDDIDIYCEITGRSAEEINISSLQTIYVGAMINSAKWMRENGTDELPKRSKKPSNKEEASLRNALKYVDTSYIKPFLALKTEEEKQKYLEMYPDIDIVIDWVGEDFLKRRAVNHTVGTPVYCRHMKLIKAWMNANNTKLLPRLSISEGMTEEEIEAGRALASIKDYVRRYKSKTEEEKNNYLALHPRIDEVMKWLEETENSDIEKESSGRYKSNRNTKYYDDMIAIKKWMDENNSLKFPSNSSDRSAEERRLGRALSNIKKDIIDVYKSIESEEEKVQFLNKYSNIEEVIEWYENTCITIDEAKKKKPRVYYETMIQIKKWMEENNRAILPRKIKNPKNDKEKEEQELAKKFGNVRSSYIVPYYSLRTDKEKEEYLKQYYKLDEVIKWYEQLPGEYYQDMMDIQVWIKENKRLPNYIKHTKDDNDREEMMLYKALKTLKDDVKEYNKNDEEGKKQYLNNHSHFEDVIKWIEEIEANHEKLKMVKKKVPTAYYTNMIKVQKWMDENNTIMFPRQIVSPKNEKEEEESKIAKSFSSAKFKYIDPYYLLETDEEKEAYLKQYERLDEVIAWYENTCIAIDEVKKQEPGIDYKNMILVEKWIDNNKRIPDFIKHTKNDADREEMRMHKVLNRLRNNVRGYKEKDEKEKEQYLIDNPRFEDVIEWVDAVPARVKKKKKDNSLCYQRMNSVENWMRENNTVMPPKCIRNENSEEGKQYNNLYFIKTKVDSYETLGTDEEKEQFMADNLRFDEVMKWYKNIPGDYYQDMLDAQEWVEENNRLPNYIKIKKSDNSRNNKNTRTDSEREEMRIHKCINELRKMANEYSEKDEEGKKQYLSNHPRFEDVIEWINEIEVKIEEKNKAKSVFYQNMTLIQGWMNENKTTAQPRYIKNPSNDKEIEEEELARKMGYIKKKVKEYEKMETDEEKERFIEKNPKFDEVIDWCHGLEKGKRVVKEVVKEQKNNIGKNTEIAEKFSVMIIDARVQAQVER